MSCYDATMTQDQVERILKDEPTVIKEISLADGRRYRVRERERWLAGFVLVLLDTDGDIVHIAYRNIVSIRFLRNGKRKRA